MIALRKSDSRSDLIRSNQYRPDNSLPSAPAPFLRTTGSHPFYIRGTLDTMHLYRVSSL